MSLDSNLHVEVTNVFRKYLDKKKRTKKKTKEKYHSAHSLNLRKAREKSSNVTDVFLKSCWRKRSVTKMISRIVLKAICNFGGGWDVDR